MRGIGYGGKNVRLYTIGHCLTHWLLWPLFAYLDFVLLVFLCNSIKLGKCWHTNTYQLRQWMLGAVCGDGSLSALFGITLLNLIVQMKYQTLYNVSKH